MEFASTGTTLSVCTTATGTYLPMYGFYTTPDLGKENDKIDVTNFADTQERQIDSGVKSFDSFTFDAYLNIKTASQSETTEILESYKYLRQAQDAGTKLYFKLTYPDGGTHTWLGTPNAFRLASNIKEALKFRLITSVESAITETYGSISTTESSASQSSNSNGETTGTETQGTQTEGTQTEGGQTGETGSP